MQPLTRCCRWLQPSGTWKSRCCRSAQLVQVHQGVDRCVWHLSTFSSWCLKLSLGGPPHAFDLIAATLMCWCVLDMPSAWKRVHHAERAGRRAGSSLTTCTVNRWHCGLLTGVQGLASGAAGPYSTDTKYWGQRVTASASTSEPRAYVASISCLDFLCGCYRSSCASLPLPTTCWTSCTAGSWLGAMPFLWSFLHQLAAAADPVRRPPGAMPCQLVPVALYPGKHPSHGSWLLGLGKAANAQETVRFQPRKEIIPSVGQGEHHSYVDIILAERCNASIALIIVVLAQRFEHAPPGCILACRAHSCTPIAVPHRAAGGWLGGRGQGCKHTSLHPLVTLHVISSSAVHVLLLLPRHQDVRAKGVPGRRHHHQPGIA